jgi:hypothetical protein
LIAIAWPVVEERYDAYRRLIARDTHVATCLWMRCGDEDDRLRAEAHVRRDHPEEIAVAISPESSHEWRILAEQALRGRLGGPDA